MIRPQENGDWDEDQWNAYYNWDALEEEEEYDPYDNEEEIDE